MTPSLNVLDATAVHPLEPLSPDEIRRAVAVVREQSGLPPRVRFVMVMLREPARGADRPHREAFLVLLDNASGRGYEAVVDLAGGRIASLKKLDPGVQPPIMLDEFVECEAAVKRSPAFREALERRGVSDVDLVMVDPWSAGCYGCEAEDDRGRRLSRALCWLRSDPRDNGYARPIEGVVAVVDLNAMEVLRVEDYGVVPLPPEPGNWSRESIAAFRPGLRPLEIVQPEGASFSVRGHEITWQNWAFRISFNPREGLVLHEVSYRDGDRVRPIVRRASVVEMVVPYGDPREQCYRKNAFDLGEYGIGMLANALTLGCDCLGLIRYFDAHMTDSRGELVTIENAVCLHEEDHGLLWKHTDWRTDQVEVRRSRRLVVSFIATVANYEYAFYWNFYQDGSLELEVKLTGIMNTTALAPGESVPYGTEVAPRLNAPIHQHFFCARLEMSVDGPRNSVYEVNTVAAPEGPDNPYGNAFSARATLLARESDARRTTDSASSRFWRVVNPHATNRLGQPVAYRLVPGANCLPYAQASAAVLKRAGFLAKHLWVTPYHPDERFPSGQYPNQNPGGDGLPRWSAADREVADREVVVWYNFGHHHVPRVEDWPVMPVSPIGFALRPDGFFERNPAMDLPPSPSKQSCCH